MGFPGSILLDQREVVTQTVDKRHPIGTRGYTRDGRVFRYSKNAGANLIIANLIQSAAPISTFGVDCAIHGGTTAAIVALTTNSSTLSVLTTGQKATAGYYNDGYLWIQSATGAGLGEGQMVQVKTQAAKATTGTGSINITLHAGEAFSVAPSTDADKGGLIANPYAELLIAPTTITSMVVGVSPIAVTADYYFWLQTWGAAVVDVSGSVILGMSVKPSGDTAGFVVADGLSASTKYVSATTFHCGTLAATIGTYSLPSLGYVMHIGADAEHAMVFLTLAP